MALTLIVMRHAKSSWDEDGLDDFDRTLNGRGRKSARAVAEWLARNGYLPGSVVVSAARRTVETWERMAGTMPGTATMRSEPALYLASADIIMGVLRAETDPDVLLIGHNPGIGDFANRLVARPPDHARFRDYPTAATTVIGFDAPGWSDVAWGTGRVAEFIVPRELLE